MRNIPLMSLADIAQSVRYGYTASASDSEVGPKFLRITDIVPPQIDWANVPYCEIGEKDLAKFSLQPGDIVIARTGATVGYAKLIRDDERSVFASYLVRVRVDPEKADPGYVGRIVESEVYKRFVRSRAGGSAQPNANAKVLSSFRLPIPEQATQARIVSILSAYDDLIKNNRRRIQLLEQTARLLYKEWFVHLRFPGHEHVTITNGVPKGWETGKVGEKATLIRGKSYKSSDLVESGGKPFVNLKCIARHGGFRLDGLKRFSGTHRDNQVVVPGDIVIAVTDMTRERHIIAHPARVPAAVGEEAVFSMDTVKLIPNETVNSSCFYYFLRFSGFSKEVREHATGTNVLHLKPKQITDYVAVFPPRLLQEQFGETARGILDQQDNLIIQNERLAKARDLLLPRLMNGEIPV